MAEAHTPLSAAERVAAAEAALPGALELAALLPQAARIERRLLRALRLELLPHRRAADEAELWSSDLVELRALDGLVLRADVQELLRQKGRALLQQRARRGAAAERANRLRQAHALMLRHHVHAPPLVQLEEEIAWLAMAQAEPAPLIERRLEVALAALVRDGRAGVARWAVRAVPRLPEAARGTKAAGQLWVASADRLPAAPGAVLPLPTGVRVVDLQALAPHLGRVPLGVRRLGDRLELGAVGPGAVAIMVPASEPRFLQLLGPFVSRGSTLQLTLPAGHLSRHPVDWGPLTLQAADGRRWEIPVLSEAEQRWLDDVIIVLPNKDGGFTVGTAVAEGRLVVAARPVKPGQAAELRPGDLAQWESKPLPMAKDVPQDARVVSLSIDKDGQRRPVVGTWSNKGEGGPTVRARAAAWAQGCLGAPVVFEGQLAGVVTRATEGPRGRADDVILQIETRPERLLSHHDASASAAAIKVELLPASYGQAVLISWGPLHERRHLLVDGGPRRTAKAVLAHVQHAVGPKHWLDLIAVSHADANRLEGVEALLSAGITAGDVWFNGPAVLAKRFGTIGAHSRAVERLEEGIKRSFRKGANAAFGGRPVVVPPEGPLPRVELAGGATLTVLAPGEPALAALAKSWNSAAAKRGSPRSAMSSASEPESELELEIEPTDGVPTKPAKATRPLKFGGDTAAHNGSSLVLLFEHAGHSVLLPGDAHAAPLVAALRRLAAERQRPGLFVDVFVLPHGGSRGNVTPELFEVLEAGLYAVSTDGSMFGHPDPETIELVARRAQGTTLVFNYRSKTTERWASAAFQREHRLRVMLPERPEGGIELAVGRQPSAGNAAR